MRDVAGIAVGDKYYSRGSRVRQVPAMKLRTVLPLNSAFSIASPRGVQSPSGYFDGK